LRWCYRMVTKEDIQIAIEYIFQKCEPNPRYQRVGSYSPERCGCLEGNFQTFKKQPKEFINLAKKKMARVM